MPASKKEPTTSTPETSTPETPSRVMPEIEQVMREELEQCIGASWGECTPTRRG